MPLMARVQIPLYRQRWWFGKQDVSLQETKALLTPGKLKNYLVEKSARWVRRPVLRIILRSLLVEFCRNEP